MITVCLHLYSWNNGNQIDWVVIPLPIGDNVDYVGIRHVLRPHIAQYNWTRQINYYWTIQNVKKNVFPHMSPKTKHLVQNVRLYVQRDL